MQLKRRLVVFPIALALIVTAFGQQKNWTLGRFRTKFVGQRIVIMQGSEIAGMLEGWRPALQDADGSYRDDYTSNGIIYKYKDQEPTVVEVQTLASATMPVAAKTVGDRQTDDNLENPSVKVYVRFDNGQLAQFQSIPSLITDQRVNEEPRSCRPLCNPDQDRWDMQLLLASERDAHAAVITQNLPGIIGRKVYAIDRSLIFSLDVTPEQILRSDRDEKQLHDIPLLTPMTIVAADYNTRYDLIVWKLRLPNGREVLSASRYRDDPASNVGNDNSFLGRSLGYLLMAVPAGLTPHEIEAIKTRKIFIGMSHRALLYSWGFAPENDYGRGGKQLVYGNGDYVYLGLDGRVANWQSTH